MMTEWRSYAPGTWFPFCHLLKLTGVWWKISNLSSQGNHVQLFNWLSILTSEHYWGFRLCPLLGILKIRKQDKVKKNYYSSEPFRICMHCCLHVILLTYRKIILYTYIWRKNNIKANKMSKKDKKSGKKGVKKKEEPQETDMMTEVEKEMFQIQISDLLQKVER